MAYTPIQLQFEVHMFKKFIVGGHVIHTIMRLVCLFTPKTMGWNWVGPLFCTYAKKGLKILVKNVGFWIPAFDPPKILKKYSKMVKNGRCCPKSCKIFSISGSLLLQYQNLAKLLLKHQKIYEKY